MSQENVEAVKAMYEAFNRGDFRAATKMLHPKAELHQPPEMPDFDSYYGRDEFVKGLVVWIGEWESPRFEPEEASEAGDYVIMGVSVSGKGKASGIETTVRFFHAWWVSDGQPRRCVVRTTEADALESLEALDTVE